MSVQTLPDHAARLAAQTCFERPLVLEAGAGTGKTGVLVARIVAWGVGPGWVRAEARCPSEPREGATEREGRVAADALSRVAAITFTEAAAAEMETRVGLALRCLAQGGIPEAVLAEALPEPETARRRARRLLENLDRLLVRTIHGFCRRLLAEDALEAGLHPRFQVDARGLHRGEVVRRAVEGRLREALSDPLDPDLVLLVGHGFGPERLEQAVLDLLEAGAGAESLPVDPLDPERLAPLEAELRGVFEALGHAGLDALSGGGKVAAETVGLLQLLRRRLESSSPLREDGLAPLADTANELASRSTWKRLRAWAKQELLAAERRCVGDPRALASAAGRLLPLLAGLRELDAPLLAAAHRILRELVVRAEAELRARGAESYQQLLRDAAALLSRPASRARARAGIDQLLVDEFQDTDAVQCRVVAALALDPPHAGAPGLFLVGDPKQSIYGWRNADLRAYEDFLARVRAVSGEPPHRLTTNFRSIPEILDEVQRAVAPVMHPVPGVQPAFEALDPCPELAGREPGAVPAVEHWISHGWDEGERSPTRKTLADEAVRLEADALARDVRRVHGRDSCWSAIGVLLRSTNELETYLEALRRHGVPYVVDRERDYTRRREVLEAGALVRSLLDPNDTIALVSVLRSAWVGVPDASWRPLWRRGFPAHARGALEGGSQALAACASLAREVEAELAEAPIPGLAALSGWSGSLVHGLRILARLRRAWLEDPIDRFVERLTTLPLLEATEAARFPGAYRLANLQRFFRELRIALEESGGDRGALLRTLRRGASDERDFEAGRPRDVGEDAVQVLTIHQAKGLDFEHVYLVQAHKGQPGGSGPEGRAAEAGEADDVFEYRLPELRLATPGWFRVIARKTQVEEAELVRTLYVALTRAKRRLVVAGLRANSASSHAGLLLEAREKATRAALERLENGSAASWDDPDGVRWVHLGRAVQPPGSRRARPGQRGLAAISAERASSDGRRLGELRREAAVRQARPRGGAASEKAHALLREHLAERGSDGDQASVPPGDAQRIATAVGSAIHGLLERFDWGEDSEAQLESQRLRFEADVARLASGALREPALERARALFDAFVAGPLWLELRRVAPRVVARELPVWIPAGDVPDGPVEFLAGAIDLLYRDADTGDLVVADFKSDHVPSDVERRARVRAYEPQGRLYCRAVREALALAETPRFELWFLEAGRIEALE